jgi:putative peptide zinc metalloprotease protein
LFRGAGVLLAIAALGGLSKRLVQSAGAVFGGVRPARAALGLTIMGIVGCVIWSLPLPRSGIETGVVRYLHPVPVRTASDGWVKQILVRRGQRIRRGDLVATLQNLELRADVAKLQYDLASATLRHRRSLAGDQMAAADAEWSNVCRLSEELELLRLQLSQLQIRAPTDGVVAAGEDLPLWLGRHVPEGTELLQLTQPGQWEICLAVDQGDHQRWTRNVGKRARVGRTRQLVWTDEAEVVRVAPTASDRLPAAALGANHGGPLAVRGSTAEEVRLTHPRFEVNLQPTSSLDLRAGQTVQVRLPGSHSCLGDAVVGSATNWVRNRLSPHSLVHQFTNL